MGKKNNIPDYIFESSWEVCNKVGGIYTVLSTRAKTLQDEFMDHVIFIGPDCWSVDNVCPYFTEDTTLFSDWRIRACVSGMKVKIGRWNVPGNPIVILVDFSPYFKVKDEIYSHLWNYYHVDSLHAYGDYDEASMFSYAAGKVVESFYNDNIDNERELQQKREMQMRALTSTSKLDIKLEENQRSKQSNNAKQGILNNNFLTKVRKLGNYISDSWDKLIIEKGSRVIEDNKKIIPKKEYLSSIKRDGRDWRANKDIDENTLQETFGFRAGEFGNWVNQKERQTTLNKDRKSVV